MEVAHLHLNVCTVQALYIVGAFDGGKRLCHNYSAKSREDVALTNPHLCFMSFYISTLAFLILDSCKLS